MLSPAPAAPEADRVARVAFDRDLLCRVERGYLDRRRAGLTAVPGLLFSVSDDDIRTVRQQERAHPLLGRHGLSAETYLAAMSAIAYLADGDMPLGERNADRRRRFAATAAFLQANRAEIRAVFTDAGDGDGVRLTPQRVRIATATIAAHCSPDATG